MSWYKAPTLVKTGSASMASATDSAIFDIARECANVPGASN